MIPIGRVGADQYESTEFNTLAEWLRNRPRACCLEGLCLEVRCCVATGAQLGGALTALPSCNGARTGWVSWRMVQFKATQLERERERDPLTGWHGEVMIQKWQLAGGALSIVGRLH